MFRFRMQSDTIQFGILVIAALGFLSSIVAWAQLHFASVEAVDGVSKRIDTEVEERRELKGEIDELYHILVPQEQQVQLRHPASIKSGR